MKNEIGKNPVGLREETGNVSVEVDKAEKELTGRERSLANLTGKGRKPGQPNKITKTIKEAVLEAVQPGACHEKGLAGWLIERAQGNTEEKKIFAAVVSRVIPIEITGANGGPVKIDLGWLTERRIGGGDVVDGTYTTQEAGEGLPSPGSTDYKSDDTEES